MRIALIGLGAIGQCLLECISNTGAAVEVAGALVARPGPRPATRCRIFSSLAQLLEAEPVLVVECGSQRALREHGPAVLASGRDLLVSSVGALADPPTHDALTGAARGAGSRLHVVAGALVGIDALAAARLVGLDSVRYERRAAPATWVRSGALDASAAGCSGEIEVFAGSAREAALRFPKNANVAATIALAGVGFDATRVRLVADPACRGNTHAIHARGAFGAFHAEISAATLSAASTSSRIVAGSLARAVLARVSTVVL